LVTVTVIAAALLALVTVTPAYWAVREWPPTPRVETVGLAEPLASGIVPSTVDLSRNFTVPVAPEVEAVAVSVTGMPRATDPAGPVRVSIEVT